MVVVGLAYLKLAWNIIEPSLKCQMPGKIKKHRVRCVKNAQLAIRIVPHYIGRACEGGKQLRGCIRNHAKRHDESSKGDFNAAYHVQI
jgi:hypothetical protein